ncbi:DNA double-strand break repair nuclease NurA [bacterium]|nr:DNA double-strand break repair nuclease NurA [bacterium]
MLDKAFLIKQIKKLEKNLFLDTSKEELLALQLWSTLCDDKDFLKKIKQCNNTPWPLPWWDNNLNSSYAIKNAPNQYGVLAIDGSQIYPDKHQGTNAFLINTGTAALWYGIPSHGNSKENDTVKRTYFNTTPYFFAEEQSGQETDTPNNTDVVNAKREELELRVGFDHFMMLKEWHPTLPLVLLLDGSLLFWHLESKEPRLKDYFFKKYCALLQKYYQEQIPLCSYLSLPKGKDIIHLLYAHLSNYGHTIENIKQIKSLNDAHIIGSFLPEDNYSTIFECRSSLALEYPKELQPHFIFINTVHELVRIEMPAYVVHNKDLFDVCCSVVLDQIHKGNGYPVALAEAHEQAVITGSDRDFFYQILENFSIQEKHHKVLSQKALKKKIMTI